jgi:hypothetical protein
VGGISESDGSVFQQTGGAQKVPARRLGTSEGKLNDERSNGRQNGTRMGRSLQGHRMPSEGSLSLDDRDREDTSEIMECRAPEKVFYVIYCFQLFPNNFIFNKECLLPVFIDNHRNPRVNLIYA